MRQYTVEVKYNGQELRFSGPQLYISRQTRLESFIFLGPGETIETPLDLAQHFDLSQAGEYEVIITPNYKRERRQEVFHVDSIHLYSVREEFFIDVEEILVPSLSLSPTEGCTRKKPGIDAQRAHFAYLEPVRMIFNISEENYCKWFPLNWTGLS